MGRLLVQTDGIGFYDISQEVSDWLGQVGVRDGLLTIFMRHTSAGLTIQENADPDVLFDLKTAMDRLAPENGPWRHTIEGPDDMPAHIKSVMTGVQLQIPVLVGQLDLGTWQGIYVAEYRRPPHRRSLTFVYQGTHIADAPL
ncbi:secondary thiamine-phosphate synthase enzyme YjbQ [Pseudovibrio exalbescens]|nr:MULTISPECIES: secondary thiamine-phosphate synthase enzyme YjbQ [Pseudovibrio]MDD7911114.1 secondary thiamine-phosphate synthase enzyme YjbQ [Pseudovibrio exalbescens]MDX5593199.1 secondary thiamine-phosphate synthase enzyme YjbQ [Pseudovibrio sp. SPO723]